MKTPVKILRTVKASATVQPATSATQGAHGARTRTSARVVRQGDVVKVLRRTTVAVPAGEPRLVFRARLELAASGRGGTCVDLPRDSAQRLGSRGRVPVRGTMNGFAFRAAALPDGKGGHTMLVNKALREDAGARPGDDVDVVLEADAAARAVKVPADLARALARAGGAARHWRGFSYACRKEYVAWIEATKQPKARLARIAQAVKQIALGKARRA